MALSKIEKLEKLCQEVRDLDNEFPPQSIQLLCAVAQRPGCAMVDICNRVNLSFAATSRNVLKLADKHNGKEGLGLLSVVPDPTNYAYKKVTLTAKGQRFLDRLCDLF